MLTVGLLCALGLYASVRMFGRARAAAAGRLDEPSVVQAPAARLFGVPNAALGLAYYPALFLAVVAGGPAARALVLLASTCALTVTLILAYDLVFRTRRMCVNCWLAHACNAMLWIVFLRALLTNQPIS